MCAAPLSGWASTLELYGLGARSVGLSGAGAAIADDYFAICANPANLALGQRVHFGLGTHLIDNRFSVDQQGGQAQYPSVLPGDLATGHLGVSAPLGGLFARRVALGIAMHIPLGAPTRIASHDLRTPQVVIYDSIGDRLVVAFGAGVRVLPWLSLGASAQLLATLEGTGKFRVSALQRRFTDKALDIDLLSRLFPILGLTVHPGDDLRVGLSWRAKAQVDYTLPIEILLEEVGTIDFTVQGVGLFTPDVFTLAASQRLGERWLVTVEAAWARWSQLPPLAPQVSLDMDAAQISAGPDVLTLLHVRSPRIEMAAKDTLSPLAGVEFQQLPWWTWRAGLRHRPTPLPKADGTANYLDAAATTLSLGGSLVLRDDELVARRPLQVDIALGYTRLSRRTVSKRDATDPVGGTSLYGHNLRLALTLHHDF